MPGSIPRDTGLIGLGNSLDIDIKKKMPRQFWWVAQAENHCGNTELRTFLQGLPGSPVFKSSPSNAGDVGSIPSEELRSCMFLQPKTQNIQQKQYPNKFNKDF